MAFFGNPSDFHVNGGSFNAIEGDLLRNQSVQNITNYGDIHHYHFHHRGVDERQTQGTKRPRKRTRTSVLRWLSIFLCMSSPETPHRSDSNGTQLFTEYESGLRQQKKSGGGRR
ncbi:hypothetical protein PM082_006613 [Marasmius tenuissimus]|nr:hypothetical protein PM082_006613 [Marasmius tenuissimus]